MRGQGDRPKNFHGLPNPSLFSLRSRKRQLQPLAYAMLRLQASFRDIYIYIYTPEEERNGS